MPDYFGPFTAAEKERLSGNPAALTGWFPIQDIYAVKCYLVHWSDLDESELDGEQFALVDISLLRDLPSALSPKYIQRLLVEDGVREFRFERKTPRDVMDAVNAHRRTVSRPERGPLCQRLSVPAAFCAYWLNEGSAWGFLDRATYEPLYGSAGKPMDIYVLRARASLTGFTKRHRAIKDLKRLMELDPANRRLYQEEIRRWERSVCISF